MSEQNLAAAIDAAKGELRLLLQKVPASVNSGSYNRAIGYKELAGSAQKELAKRSPKYATLRELISRLNAY